MMKFYCKYMRAYAGAFDGNCTGTGFGLAGWSMKKELETSGSYSHVTLNTINESSAVSGCI